jgi:hypothetical protein
MSITPSLYAKARSEIIALFHWNADSLSPDQTLRLDCAVSLRLCLDHLQGCIIRGESIDVSRMLTASEALSRLLPPSALAVPPSEQHGDPRVKMFEIYMQMRERGEVPPEGWHQHRINELEAENEALKAQLTGGPAPALPDVSQMRQATSDLSVRTTDDVSQMRQAIDLAEADITPPSELGVARVGIERGPDDPPPRSTRIIEANPPAAPAAPAYDYSANDDWKDFVEPDGTIRSTPRGRGHYWGPV